MTSATLRILASLVLVSSTVGLAACGATVTGDDGADDDGQSDGGDDDGGDDDGGTPDCADPAPDCIGPVCVDGFWQCTGPDPVCPEVEPFVGEPCGGDLSCRYEAGIGECDPAARTYDCVDGIWSAPRHDRCSPPYECPATRPDEGSPCDVEGIVCEYGDGTECGYPPTFECIDGAWENIEDTFFRCSLPACTELTDPTTCADLGCRWLEPGCGDETIPSLPSAGCFDPEPCSEGSCYFGDEVCTQVMIESDCVDCDACGQAEMLCIAQPQEERAP